jgi:hypothetical protein
VLHFCFRVFVFATALSLLSFPIFLSDANAAPKKPDTPSVQRISTKKSGNNKGTVTIRVAISKQDRKGLLKTEVKVGKQSCTMKKSATQCSIRGVNLGGNLMVRARSQNRSGFSRWSGAVKYLAQSGNTWTSDSRQTSVAAPVTTAPSTTLPAISVTQTIPPTTSSTTSTSTTTTTIPYCTANPVPLNQLVFGRAWLSGNFWNIPGVEQASRYGRYPSAIVQPSRCQNFGFNMIQARATTSTSNDDWVFVPYTLVTTQFSTYAQVIDAWEINLDFRFVFEIYNMSSSSWEIRHIWYSPYSCGYTCIPKSWVGLL